MEKFHFLYLFCKASVSVYMGFELPRHTGLTMLSINPSEEIVINANQIFNFPTDVQYE